ncbi:MAG: hypothetical protein LBK99_23640 [Opitutaceae bacterium]|nr:hypothetical protein [Opitutaceae bacterium]
MPPPLLRRAFAAILEDERRADARVCLLGERGAPPFQQIRPTACSENLHTLDLGVRQQAEQTQVAIGYDNFLKRNPTAVTENLCFS